ncbi:MAG: alpha/beta hydrolase [Thermoleophilia bacterium]|nr:alpha/beta hydrolase [Thermoleophilia bacterium]
MRLALIMNQEAGIPNPRQLERKVKTFRLLSAMFGKIGLSLSGGRRGKEVYLDTQQGKVRALLYGFENEEVRPLYINLHGGGFVLGNPEMEDRYLPGLAEAAGVKIISVDYSLAPEAPFPVALDECYAVALYAKEHASELRIDPTKIGIGGQSAGGNLSAAVCLMDGERKELGIKCLVLVYPPLDLYTDPINKPKPKGAISPKMARMFDAAYVGERGKARNPLISPYYATAEQLRLFPPTLVITAELDSLAPEAEAFAEKLREAGVEVTLRRFEGARHGFNVRGDPGTQESWQLVAQHLRRHLQT